jgi:cholesterol transport system auxiliary component
MRRTGHICVMPAVLLLAGCSLLLPPKSEPAKAVLSKIPDDVPHERRHAATLLVLLPEASPAYDTTRMAYSVRLYQVAYFRDNEWAETPAQMLQSLLVRTMQRTGFFRAILTPPETGGRSYELRTKILDLVQDYTASPPVLRVALRVRLLGASGQLIAGREIDLRQAMREATPYAGVIAANDALAKMLRGVARFVLDSVH